MSSVVSHRKTEMRPSVLGSILVVIGVLAVSGCSSSTVASPTTGSFPNEPTTTLYVSTQPKPGSIGQFANEISKSNPGALRVWGDDQVTLRADQESLAKEFIRRFGDQLQVKLGFFDYPMNASAATLCPPYVHAPGEEGGLRASMVLNQSSVTFGADFEGTVTVKNVGNSTISFEGGDPVVAIVRSLDTHAVVGMYDGIVGGVGTGASLMPGESSQISLFGGTASCDPKVGFALPPGRYEVVTEVLGPSTSGPSEPLRLSAGPVELVVEPVPSTR